MERNGEVHIEGYQYVADNAFFNRERYMIPGGIVQGTQTKTVWDAYSSARMCFKFKGGMLAQVPELYKFAAAATLISNCLT